ncbi:MAG: saccharopine dehydrogenase [Rhodobacterales bacterium]|jgi:saccharopine dehydrogenase (NAD+, L-lysine-forming)
MTHLWVRAEQRSNEARVGVTPEGAKTLIDAGLRVTVEHSTQRAIALDGYRAAGCDIAPENTWSEAPNDAVIFGLKELPEDGTALHHRHIMFGHAYKGQHGGRILLRRFKVGGGTLYDLEYLVDESGRRVAAFGYWAGYAGAAISVKCWADQQRGRLTGAIGAFANKQALLSDLIRALAADAANIAPNRLPRAIVIGALGRVGKGAADLCRDLDIEVTKWDIAETARGAPFPEILTHDIFLNCILARPQTPVFVPASALSEPRQLSVIGDIACDPDSDYNPIPVYDRATTWHNPALRVHQTPPLDVMAIDNLPSLLPVESSQDYAAQLLPVLTQLAKLDQGIWGQAAATFQSHVSGVC